VQRVKAVLAAAGSKSQIIAFDDSAGSAVEAAERLDVALGAIVKSLVFIVDGDPVMALIAGDRRCDTAACPLVRASGGVPDLGRDRVGGGGSQLRLLRGRLCVGSAE